MPRKAVLLVGLKTIDLHNNFIYKTYGFNSAHVMFMKKSDFNDDVIQEFIKSCCCLKLSRKNVFDDRRI